jgi:hypothetical protein
VFYPNCKIAELLLWVIIIINVLTRIADMFIISITVAGIGIVRLATGLSKINGRKPV